MFQANNRVILLSRGDTGILRFAVEGVSLTERDRAVFTVKNSRGVVMIRKIVQPDKPDEIRIPLVNSDTENILAGSYEWDIRVVIEAKLAANGDVVDGSAVATPYPPGIFRIVKVVGSV